MSRKVHIVHVGSMANRGTQALLSSDVSVIRSILGFETEISVSTTDVAGVKRLGLPLTAVMQAVVDIPYERADVYAKRVGCARASFRYKAFAVVSLFYMFMQIVMSLVSVALVKAGFKMFYRADVIYRLKKCDVVVSCSDENFKESASMLPFNIYWMISWWSMLVARTWKVLLARFLGKPVVVFPNSVGPFQTFVGRFLSRLALSNCEFVLVREPISYGIVESLGIKSRTILTYDTALLYSGANVSSAEKCAGNSVGVSVGVYSNSLPEKNILEFVSTLADVLDDSIDQFGFSVVLLPHYVSGFKYDDLEISRLVLGRMRNAAHAKICEVGSLEEFKSAISRMDMVVSSKMHPVVLASSSFVPTVSITYDHKQTGFALSLGLGDCVVPLREVSRERLLSRIQYVWKNREEIRSRLKAQVPEMQKNVRESIRRVLVRSLTRSSERRAGF